MASNRRLFPNNFGYDHKKSPPGQLRKALQMENDEKLEEILSTIRDLTRKELDMDRMGNFQERQIDSIKRMLKRKYPGTFGLAVKESERRLYFLHKYILYAHSVNRNKKVRNKEKEPQKRKNIMEESTKAKGPSASLDLQSLAVERSSQIETAPSCNKNTSKLSKSTKRNQRNIAPSGCVADRTPQASKPSRRIPTTSSQASPPKAPVFAQESSLLPSDTLASSQRSSAQVTSTRSPGESVVPSHQYGATIRPIYEFLDACVPSMTHHLQSFLEFGCSTPEHLFGMSMWQPGMIHEVLDRLPPNVRGERLTEMEKLIIQNHVLTYFKS